MGAKSKIEWTDATWNPLRGCSRVSEGCRNCYAERQAARFNGEGQPFEGLVKRIGGESRWTGKVELNEKHLLDPLKWKHFGDIECVGKGKEARLRIEVRPRRIFVNSMSDLFHSSVPDEWIDRIFAVMALCPQHTFQVLTKRPERMAAYLGISHSGTCLWAGIRQQVEAMGFPDVGAIDKVLPNVWLGVSVENQAAADERIELLLRTPAALRFVSIEPMLGPINLGWVGCECDTKDAWDGAIDALRGKTWIEEWDNADGSERTRVDCQIVPKLDWVICGGESGPGARPMHPDWARRLRDQCAAADVPFFFKQWGEWMPWNSISEEEIEHLASSTPTCLVKSDGRVIRPFCAEDRPGQRMCRVGKKAAGSLLDGVEHKAFPESR